jgi:CRISPR/Cas system Type II protein with McrA/HNH and RuvC-like nuclease domain
MKERILSLRAQGKSYNDIVAIIGCSKSIVHYHCSENGRADTKRRSSNKRKIDPLFRKVDNFKHTRSSSGFKVVSGRPPHAVLSLRLKMFKTHRGHMHCVRFTRNDVIAKFGKHPTCYLTGKQLDFNLPDTYTLDHRVPRSRGGDNSLANLEVCCQEANNLKGTLLIQEMLDLCKDVLIHHGYQVTKSQH